MSRDGQRMATVWSGFPRMSGDEPITLDVQGATVEFSPRERG